MELGTNGITSVVKHILLKICFIPVIERLEYVRKVAVQKQVISSRKLSFEAHEKPAQCIFIYIMSVEVNMLSKIAIFMQTFVQLMEISDRFSA
jgi:hypothetical protein